MDNIVIDTSVIFPKTSIWLRAQTWGGSFAKREVLFEVCSDGIELGEKTQYYIAVPGCDGCGQTTTIDTETISSFFRVPGSGETTVCPPPISTLELYYDELGSITFTNSLLVRV